MNLDPELLLILACPACKGDLELIEESEREVGLCCRSCQLVYPIRDEMPILLREESIKLVDWESGKRS